ncbi:putative carboxylesterase [Abeliophyllum distichum]|uniref:Carboxylesterase n=1 Tax=Abeliophyllum distichum TaxID=126358 RepID=A0ABD1PU61_9LAMI
MDFSIKVQDDGSATWKDCLFDKKHNLYLYLYKPLSASNAKLPILYFFHGGGFCLDSHCCHCLSSALPTVVISPDYRLAPEHRLLAAMDNALSAIKWLQIQALSNNPDPWLSDGVDVDWVFTVGDFSGGNLAHHLAVKLGPRSPELSSIKVTSSSVSSIHTTSHSTLALPHLLNILAVRTFNSYLSILSSATDVEISATLNSLSPIFFFSNDT